MTSRIWQIAAGVALYVVLVLALHALVLVAYSGGNVGTPLWFASARVLLEPAMLVLPGVLVGWLSREPALKSGAIVGAVGAAIAHAIQLGLWGASPLEISGWRLAIAGVFSLLAASITNAIGALAGATLRNQL